MTNKFTLSKQDQETYKDIKIYHVYKNDKYADLPLLIHCENGKKAIIPTFKNQMRSVVPDYFNIFKKKGGHFEESRHEDGRIYEMEIPGLLDPWYVKKYIQNFTFHHDNNDRKSDQSDANDYEVERFFIYIGSQILRLKVANWFLIGRRPQKTSL